MPTSSTETSPPGPIVPRECGGKWIAWTLDGSRIVGVGDTLDECETVKNAGETDTKKRHVRKLKSFGQSGEAGYHRISAARKLTSDLSRMVLDATQPHSGCLTRHACFQEGPPRDGPRRVRRLRPGAAHAA